MARDLILHIGTNKTGSTSIQKVLSVQRKEILAQGMCYPRSPGEEKHWLLSSLAATKRNREYGRVWKFTSPQPQLEKFRSEFDTEMRNLPQSVRRVILSAEQFSFVLKDVQAMKNLRDLLTPYFDDIKVVIYIRRPDQHLTSLYSEAIRWGDARLPGLANLQLPAGHAYDYYGLLDRWASVFGDASMSTHIFERRPGEKFDVVQHFLDLCGLTLTIPPKKSTANEAFSLPAQLLLAEIARQINNGGKHANVSGTKWRAIVGAAGETLPGKGWQPTQAEAKAFNDRYAENHERVRARWFPDRETLFSQDYSELPVEAVVVDPKTLYDASIRLIVGVGNAIEELEGELAKMTIRVAEKEGNNKRLKNNLAKRIELYPDNVEARVKLARILTEEGDLAAAGRLVDAALQIKPKSGEALALRNALAREASHDQASTQGAAL